MGRQVKCSVAMVMLALICILMVESNIDAISALESLLVGRESKDFRELDRLTNVFCPFEAVGMVRQEIRHSNFLAYILDPNKPHGFDDAILEDFLYLLSLQGDARFDASRLDFYFADLSKATVRREWRNIDLLIEVPPGSMSGTQHGIVIAIELKVDARESKDQLPRYKEVIQKEFPQNYRHAFVFLTARSELASGENSEDWLELGLEQVAERLEALSERFKPEPGAGTLLAYTRMLRRHILENPEIDALAKKIWARHSTALEILYNHRPDFISELQSLIDERSKAMMKAVSAKIGLTLYRDDSETYPIFLVDEWERHPELMSGEGDEAFHLMGIEVHNWSNDRFYRLRTTFTLWSGEEEDQEARQNLFEAIRGAGLKVGRKDAPRPDRPKYMTAAYVSETARGSDREMPDLNTEADAVVERLKSFLIEYVPQYDRIIRETFP